MSNSESKLKVALRRNQQKREAPSYLDAISRIVELDSGKLKLLDAGASLGFEEALLERTRKGMTDGSIRRTTEISADELESAIAEVLPGLGKGPVIVAPVNSMHLAFELPRAPSPRQLHELLLLDGDTIFVVSNDLASGVGVDFYDSEKRIGKCFEVDSWCSN
jgi:hypothetical protein